MFAIIHWKQKCNTRTVIVTIALCRLNKIFLIGNLLVQVLFLCGLFLSSRFRSLAVFGGHFLSKRFGRFKETFPQAGSSFVEYEWRMRERRPRRFKSTSRKCLQNHDQHNNAVWFEDSYRRLENFNKEMFMSEYEGLDGLNTGNVSRKIDWQKLFM